MLRMDVGDDGNLGMWIYGVGPPVRREKKKKEGEHRSRGDQKIPERIVKRRKKMKVHLKMDVERY